LSEDYANQLYNIFSKKSDNWYIYENPIELKFVYDNINELDRNITYRCKAHYILTDESEKNNKDLMKLCEIRSNRRLNLEDIKKYAPDFKFIYTNRKGTHHS
jgi:hypothetical protein